MNGYLQRLVSTAAGRSDAVHPRTRSIFSPGVEEMHAPLRAWEDIEQGTPVRAPARPHAPQRDLELHPPSRRLEPRSGAPRSEHTPLLPNSVAPEDRAAAPPPFVLEAADSFADPVRSVDHPTRTAAPLAEAPRHFLATETEITVTSPAATRADDAFRPVIKTARSFDAVSAAESRQHSRQQPPLQAAQPPDDIQIHIGRIEVVAVPPPAPQPRAPRAPDRSLSLDAYLNRRDRRTR